MATEADLNTLGYQMLQAGKVDDAITTFRDNVMRHPESWNVYDSLGEALAVKGRTQEAAENYRKALTMTKDDKQKQRINDILARL